MPADRLHQSWQYRQFFQQSQVFRLSECVVFRIPNHLTHARLGMTIKARGLSVDRNRVKRLIREFFRHIRAQLKSYDYLIVIPWHKKLGHPYPLVLKTCLQKQFYHAIFPDQ